MRSTIKENRGFTLVELTVAMTVFVVILSALNVYGLFMRRQIVTRAGFLYPRAELASVYGDLHADVLRARRSFGFSGRIFQGGALWQAGPVSIASSLSPTATPTDFLTAADLTNEARSDTYTLCLLDGTGQASVWIFSRDSEPSGLRYRVTWFRYAGRGSGTIDFQSTGFTTAFEDQPTPAVSESGANWQVSLPNPAFAYTDFLQGCTPTQPTLVVPKMR